MKHRQDQGRSRLALAGVLAGVATLARLSPPRASRRRAPLRHRDTPAGEKATAVWTLGGRRIAVEPDQFCGAKANYVIQGTGGDGLKRARVLLWERRGECPSAEVVLAVHDEVVVEVPEADAERAKARVGRCMVDAMAPLINPVPVEFEAFVGRTWGG